MVAASGRVGRVEEPGRPQRSRAVRFMDPRAAMGSPVRESTQLALYC